MSSFKIVKILAGIRFFILRMPKQKEGDANERT